MIRQPTIIPVASGKGGVGKSLIGANLALALGRLGHATVLADLDLGNPGAHACLGMEAPETGLGDYLATPGKVVLADYLSPTPWRNLRLLGGGHQAFAANLPHGKKLKLIRQLSRLPAQYLIVDLGAGSHYNTLDFFRMASHGLLVTTPDPAAVSGMQRFLQHLAWRACERALRHRPMPRQRLLAWLQRNAGNAPLHEMAHLLEALDPEAAALLRQACLRHQPRLLLNMGNHPDQLDVLDEARQYCAAQLSMHAEAYGFVFEDPLVRTSLRSGTPLLELDEQCPAAQGILHLAQHVVHLWDKPREDSGGALRNHTRKFHEYLQADARPRPARLIPGTLRQFFPGLFG